MRCPKCSSDRKIWKKGFYKRPSDKKTVQRYICGDCQKTFSEQTFHLQYRRRVRHLDQILFRLLSRGTSQRQAAEVLKRSRAFVDSRIERFGEFAKINHALDLSKHRKKSLKIVMFDEMETSEHTKLKPVTMPISIDPETRKILTVDVAQIAAKGHLASISVKKYGPRKCMRAKALNSMFSKLIRICDSKVIFKTDESKHYPSKINKWFPKATKIAFKGKRGCVVGQGELKRSGRDPLFQLNHTYAMIRDRVKRLARRTWTTTKKLKKLESLLYIYVLSHNQRVTGNRKEHLPLSSVHIDI